MANYTENKKIPNLDITAIALADYIIFGDTSDAGKAKAITQAAYELWIANSDNFIDALTANATFITNIGGIGGAVNSVTSGDLFLEFSPTTGNVVGTLDVVALANDSLFVTTLAANDEFANALIANETFTTNLAHDENFTTELGNDSNFISTLTNNSEFQTAVNNFVTGGGSVRNISEQFDDFVTSNSLSSADDTNLYISGNFVSDTPGLNGQIPSEEGHPGIFRISDLGEGISGFSNSESGAASNDYNLSFNDDFDIRILNRVDYNVSGTSDFKIEYQLAGSPNFALINIETTGGAAPVVGYDIGGGTVPTAVDVPPIGDWFEVRYTMVAGVLTMRMNNVTVYTGTPGFTGNFGVRVDINVLEAPTTASVDIDWVRTIYRSVISGGAGLGATQFLPISRDVNLDSGEGEGMRFNVNGKGRQVLHDEVNDRIYVALAPEQGASTSEGRKPRMRIFRNQFGSYYVESEIAIDYTMLTDAQSTTNISVAWALSPTFLWAAVRQIDAGDNSGIDLIRFNLDGSGGVTSNIYSIADASDRLEDLGWDTDDNITALAACAVGNSIFMTYLSKPTDPDPFVCEVREYDISAFPTLTLLNTYAVSEGDAENQDQGHQLVYDESEDVFLMLGLDDDAEASQITKYQISGSNFVYAGQRTYPELAYGSISSSTADDTGKTIYAHLVPTSSYYTIYNVMLIQNARYGGSDNTEYNSWWLETRKYPKF